MDVKKKKLYIWSTEAQTLAHEPSLCSGTERNQKKNEYAEHLYSIFIFITFYLTGNLQNKFVQWTVHIAFPGMGKVVFSREFGILTHTQYKLTTSQWII